MATLDQFIAEQEAGESKEYVPYEELELANLGGSAFILNQTGGYNVLGLGQLDPIYELHNNSDQNQSSGLFQELLDTRQDYQIFRAGASLIPPVSGGILNISPEPGTYEAIRDGMEALYGAVNALNNSVRDSDTSRVRKRIGRINDLADYPEVLMKNLVTESNELSVELITCLPGWISGKGGASVPQEYEKVKQAYEDVKSACRNGSYTLQISEQARQAQWIKRVSVSPLEGQPIPYDRQELFILDTKDELAALAQGNIEPESVLYRGPQDSASEEMMEQLGDAFIISANLRTRSDYADHLNSR